MKIDVQAHNVVFFFSPFPSSVFQVSAEFKFITTMNLEPIFMEKLDMYTPKQLSIFQSKSGAVGERHRAKMCALLQVLNHSDPRMILKNGF